MRPFVEANDYSPLQVYPQNGRSMCRREAPLLCLTHPLSVVHRFGGGGDLFDRVRDVACQVDRVGNDPLGVRRWSKQQAAHEAEDKFVFHEDWGDKGNEGIK